jgi:hypothetical protein
MRCSVSPRGSLKPLPHSKGYSNVSRKTRAFLGAVSIFAGTCACFSPALGEVEEDSGQDGATYSISVLSSDTVTNFSANDSVDDDVSKYLSTPSNSTDNIDSARFSADLSPFPSVKNPYVVDDILIPATVWSLDVSTGTHLDHASSDPDPEFHTTGWLPEITDVWIRALFGSWSSGNTYAFTAPPPFQVASCGGGGPERSNLDYCDNNLLLIGQLLKSDPQKSERPDKDVDTPDADNNMASNSTGQSGVAPFPSAIANFNSLLNGTLSILGRSGDVSVSSATTQMASPGTILDVAESSTDDLTPSTDPPIPVSDPGISLGPPPVVTSQRRPIPEPSTWVMTIVGFSIMAAIFGRKRRARLNHLHCRPFGGSQRTNT